MARWRSRRQRIVQCAAGVGGWHCIGITGFGISALSNDDRPNAAAKSKENAWRSRGPPRSSVANALRDPAAGNDYGGKGRNPLSLNFELREHPCQEQRIS